MLAPQFNLWGYILANLFALAFVSYIWLPFVFLAYAMGRKRFGIRFLFIVMTAEALAVGLASYLFYATRWASFDLMNHPPL